MRERGRRGVEGKRGREREREGEREREKGRGKEKGEERERERERGGEGVRERGKESQRGRVLHINYVNTCPPDRSLDNSTTILLNFKNQCITQRQKGGGQL